MIINFSIKNFGSIKDKQTLSFEAAKSDELEEYYVVEPIEGLRLLKLALIFGANASGKSTILEAIDFLRDITLDPLEKKSETLDFEPFLFDELTPKQNSLFSLEFVQKGIKYQYDIEFNKNAIINEDLYQYNPKKAYVYKRTTEVDKQLTQITFGNKQKISKAHITALEANTIWNNTVLGAFQKTNIESEILADIIDWFRNTLKPIVTPKTDLKSYVSGRIEKLEIKKENVIKILKKADLMIDDIKFEERQEDINEDMLKALKKKFPKENVEEVLKDKKITLKNVLFQHTVNLPLNNKTSYTLPLMSESLGTQRYYGLGGLLDLLIRNNQILPTDEIDSSLHPDLLEHFLLTFLANSKHSQLIATTHYREFLMQKDMFRNDAIWFTEKQQDGSTEIYSADDFDSSVIRKESSIYNAYKIGKLGATPNLGDYYIDLEDDGAIN